MTVPAFWFHKGLCFNSLLCTVLSWVLQNGLLRMIHQWLKFSSIIKKTLSSAENLFDQAFYQVTSQQSFESLLGLCGKQDEQIGHSIASKALALADLSLVPLQPVGHGGGHVGGQTGHTRTCIHLLLALSRWLQMFLPCSPCARVAVLPPVVGGPSDLGGLDSSQRMSSFGVGRAGWGAFRGQV